MILPVSSETPLPPNSLSLFAQLCDALAATRSKLAKRALLVEYLTQLDDDAAPLAAIYLTGQPFAEADRRTLQVGGSLLSRAVQEVSGANDAAMSAAYRNHGDLGAAALDLLLAAKHAPIPTLTLSHLAAVFASLAENGKRAARQTAVIALLRNATALEAKFVLKIMLGDIRTGVKQSLVEEAIAAAYPAPLAEIRRAVLYTGDIGEALLAARQGTLAQVQPSLFHPLGFMLASPVEEPAEAFARHAAEAASPTLLVEDKFDGMRAQAHCQAGRVALYSRNREDITASFPELVTALASIADACILDGEVLGWDHSAQRALPFATFSNRLGRKVVSRELLQSTPVAFMAFDCLFAAGRMLLEEPLAARRHILAEVVQSAAILGSHAAIPVTQPQAALFDYQPEQTLLPAAPLLISQTVAVSSVEEMEAAFAAARERGNEGLMIKDPHSLYTPGRRGYAWLKLKKELATLDVVITGAEFGHGRRAGILSDYTFAVRDSEGELRNIGKAYSGLTDVEINELSDWCKQHTVEDLGHFRTVDPQIILEVAFNNIMRSTRHSSGFALRFPRILRLRPDKPLSEIDTLERAEEIYQSQPDRPAAM
jgi:DNA ligase-1